MEFDLNIDHILQRRIIEKLTYAKALRFSELKPSEVESNLFMYHLKQLIKLHIVKKTDEGYRLTPTGLAHVDKLNLKNFTHRVQAKIVTILAIEHQDGRWLMLRRQHQPYIGGVGFPSGKVHYGEDLTAAAQRELQERTNIANIPLQLRGSANLKFVSEEVTISNILAYIFYGVTNTTAGEHEDRGNKTYWSKLPESERNEYIPGYLTIHQALKDNPKQLFFLENTYNVDHLLQ